MPKILIALILLVGTQLTACGQKGPLFIPEDPDAKSAAATIEKKSDEASEIKKKKITE